MEPLNILLNWVRCDQTRAQNVPFPSYFETRAVGVI